MSRKQYAKSCVVPTVTKGCEDGMHVAPVCQVWQEKDWKPCIVMLVGSSPEDSRHIDTLVLAIKIESYDCDKTGEQYPFNYISHDDLYSQVMKLGSGANGKEVRKMCELYHVGEELPPFLLAQLIKIRLLAIRDAELKLRDAVNKTLAGRFFGMLKLGRNKLLKTIGFRDESCGDEDPLYVVLSGFHHPRVLTFLAEIGITVDCIVRIEPKPMSDEQYQKTKTASSANTGINSAAAAEANDEEMKKLASELETFWRDVQPTLDDDDLCNVACLRCFVDSVPLLQDEPYSDALHDMFDDISSLLEKFSEAKRQWKNYVALSGKILPIVSADPDPTIISDGAGCSISCHVSTSSASLLDSTAQSAAPDLEVKTDGYAEVCVVKDGLSHQSEAVPLLHIEEPDDCVSLSAIAFKLTVSAKQETELRCVFTPPQPHVLTCTRKPLLISYHDDITRQLNNNRSVDGCDPEKAELESFGFTHLDASAFGDKGNSTGKIVAERATRFMKLLSCCSGQSEDSDITNALNQFIFESIDLSKMDEVCLQVAALPDNVGTVLVATEVEKFVEEPTNQVDKTDDKPVTPGKSVNQDIIVIDGTGNKLVYARPPHSDEQQQQQPITRDDAGFELLFCDNREQPIPSDSSLTMPEGGEDMTAIVNSTATNEKQYLDAYVVELMEPLQTLLKALQTHASVDIYCNCLDQSILIVLRNTFRSTFETKRNAQLQSNIRFRDCLEQAAATGDKWLQETDIRRPTDWLYAEVRRLRKEKRLKAQEDEKLAKLKATQEETRATKPESVPPSANNLTVQSIKIGAWNEELERIKLEVKEDEEKLAARAKRLQQIKLEMKQEEEMVAALVNNNKLASTGNRLTRQKRRRRSLSVPDSETADPRTIGAKQSISFALWVACLVSVLAMAVFAHHTSQAAPSRPNTVETRDFALSEETDPTSPLSTLEQESMPESLRVKILISRSEASISSSPSPPLEQLPVETVHSEELPESESPSTFAIWYNYFRKFLT